MLLLQWCGGGLFERITCEIKDKMCFRRDRTMMLRCFHSGSKKMLTGHIRLRTDPHRSTLFLGYSASTKQYENKSASRNRNCTVNGTPTTAATDVRPASQQTAHSTPSPCPAPVSRAEQLHPRATWPRVVESFRRCLVYFKCYTMYMSCTENCPNE